MMKDLYLSLNSPCLEQWDNMHKSETGRYCDRCEKNIIDLTGKSDAELLKFFKAKKDNVCGRLLASQLNRPLNVATSNPTLKWLLPLAFSAAAISPALGQPLKPAIQHVDDLNSSGTIKNSESAPDTSKKMVSGKVVNHINYKPLSGVKIRQDHFKNVLAITDSNGNFRLSRHNLDINKPFNFELDGQPVLRIFLKDNMIVKMDTTPQIILGRVAVSTPKQQPLYIIYSGKNKCTLAPSELHTLSPDWVEKLEVLSGPQATALYGKKGINGVIIIGIKKEFAGRFDFSKH